MAEEGAVYTLDGKAVYRDFLYKGPSQELGDRLGETDPAIPENEMERQFRQKTGVPTVMFDGDQSDPRCFSEAQYETRIAALAEIMEENKLRKEAGNNA